MSNTLQRYYETLYGSSPFAAEPASTEVARQVGRALLERGQDKAGAILDRLRALGGAKKLSQDGQTVLLGVLLGDRAGWGSRPQPQILALTALRDLVLRADAGKGSHVPDEIPARAEFQAIDAVIDDMAAWGVGAFADELAKDLLAVTGKLAPKVAEAAAARSFDPHKFLRNLYAVTVEDHPLIHTPNGLLLDVMLRLAKASRHGLRIG